MEDVGTGFVFRPEDPVDLAKAIERYFASELYANLNSRRAEIRDYAVRRHSWAVVAQTTMGVYADLLRMPFSRKPWSPGVSECLTSYENLLMSTHSPLHAASNFIYLYDAPSAAPRRYWKPLGLGYGQDVACLGNLLVSLRSRFHGKSKLFLRIEPKKLLKTIVSN